MVLEVETKLFRTVCRRFVFLISRSGRPLVANHPRQIPSIDSSPAALVIWTCLGIRGLMVRHSPMVIFRREDLFQRTWQCPSESDVIPHRCRLKIGSAPHIRASAQSRLPSHHHPGSPSYPQAPFGNPVFRRPCVTLLASPSTSGNVPGMRRTHDLPNER